MNVLCVVAHRDDDVLGCAGTIARHVDAGESVTVAYLGQYGLVGRSDPYGKTIIYEAAMAREALGVDLYAGTLFPDNRFDITPLLVIVQEVEAMLERTRADIVYCPAPSDLNIDHRLTCQAVLTATRPVPGQTVKVVYGMEVLSSTEWAFGAPPFTPNVFVPLTDDQMARKRAALACYASELRPFPHPRSVEAVDALARYRGSQCGHPWAEAFQLLREIK